MTSKLIQVIGVGVAASAGSALAGDLSADPIQAPASSGGGGDWCETLEDIGKVYTNKKNPYIQEVKFFGRAHQQWTYSDGDYNGSDFSGNGDELRRLRFGASVEFLNGFKAVGRANFETGGFRDTSIGYDNWDELFLEYEFGDVAGFDDVVLGYGRYKIGFGGEERTSSKKIKTVERSNLNNFFANSRSTGARLEFSRGKVDFTAGIYTTDGGPETFGQWDGGTAYHLVAEFEALGGDVTLQGLYHDQNDAENDSTVGYDWAVSATYETEIGNWDLFTNATYGDTQDGDVYGVVIMPSTFLIEDRLEAVVRYQWAHSTGEQISAGSGSRGLRRIAMNDGVNAGKGPAKGNDNHTIYAGLNYYFCDHNLKLMTGVEYETLDGKAGDTEATTVWGGLRFYF